MADGPKMYMSGDLGGTNFRISLFAVDASDGLAPVPPGGACPGKLVHHARYRCADFMEAGFADMVGAFLEECRAEKGVEGAPLAACFSVRTHTHTRTHLQLHLTPPCVVDGSAPGRSSRTTPAR